MTQSGVLAPAWKRAKKVSRPFFTAVLLSLMFVAAPTVFARGRSTGAPDFTLPASEGSVSLHDLRGKVVYVDFWASWCGPCRQSFPWMNSLVDRYGQKGLAVVAVNLDKNRDLAESFLQQFPANFKVVFDPSGNTAEAFHVEAMPSSFIVGRDGKIISTHEGFQQTEASSVEKRIEEALAQ